MTLATLKQADALEHAELRQHLTQTVKLIEQQTIDLEERAVQELALGADEATLVRIDERFSRMAETLLAAKRTIAQLRRTR